MTALWERPARILAAEIKDYDSARKVLAEIQDDPTAEGQLARAYARIERLQQMLSKREERGVASIENLARARIRLERLALDDA